MPKNRNLASFADLHVPGTPLVLYNIWDAGSAKALSEAGAKALATGSWSVAAAQGYADGENIPFALLLMIVQRITASCELPLSVDFEGGFSQDLEDISTNIGELLHTGVVGINFEDQQIGGTGLYSIAQQCDRISALRRAARERDIELFVNSRTDLFLKEKDRTQHKNLQSEAIERSEAYAEAGASGFFVPGLQCEKQIAELCNAVRLPINVMMMEGMATHSELAQCGVARISYGPGPYIKAMASLVRDFKAITNESLKTP